VISVCVLCDDGKKVEQTYAGCTQRLVQRSDGGDVDGGGIEGSRRTSAFTVALCDHASASPPFSCLNHVYTDVTSCMFLSDGVVVVV